MSDVNRVISYKSLVRKNTQNCEFCDRTFRNKYQCIVHNASHIIIPLLKLDVHSCEQCSEQFTTQEKLLLHTITSHPINVKLEKVICEVADPNLVQQMPITSQIIPKSEKISIKDRIMFENDICHHGIQNNVKSKRKVALATCDPPWYRLPRVGDARRVKPKINTSHIDLIDTPMNDTTVDIFENHTSAFGSFKEAEAITYSNAMVFRPMEVRESPRMSSVLYDELVRPVPFKCPHCIKLFANRFTLIQHEINHIQITKLDALACSICDNYYTDDKLLLHEHRITNHPDIKVGRGRLRVCKKCGLKYKNYMKHKENKHLKVHRAIQPQGNADEKHMRKLEKKREEIYMCDLCLSFLKKSLHYAITGLKELSDAQCKCHGCGKMFFELNKVVRSSKKRAVRDARKRPLSNEVRLKNIQQRLKRMK